MGCGKAAADMDLLETPLRKCLAVDTANILNVTLLSENISKLVKS